MAQISLKKSLSAHQQKLVNCTTILEIGSEDYYLVRRNIKSEPEPATCRNSSENRAASKKATSDFSHTIINNNRKRMNIDQINPQDWVRVTLPATSSSQAGIEAEVTVVRVANEKTPVVVRMANGQLKTIPIANIKEKLGVNSAIVKHAISEAADIMEQADEMSNQAQETLKVLNPKVAKAPRAGKPRLTKEQILERNNAIRAAFAAGKSNKEIVDEFKLDPGYISNLKTGKRV